MCVEDPFSQIWSQMLKDSNALVHRISFHVYSFCCGFNYVSNMGEFNGVFNDTNCKFIEATVIKLCMIL